jgi:trans-L-3-hydroxyproline dehydratase
MDKKMNWDHGDGSKVQSIEMHTGGEPLRVLTDGLPKIKGKTILEKRRYFREHFDFIRTGTMWEPRGHADMYGAILTEPVTPDGDFGVFFRRSFSRLTVPRAASYPLLTGYRARWKGSYSGMCHPLFLPGMARSIL